jgi:hypothetical protein
MRVRLLSACLPAVGRQRASVALALHGGQTEGGSCRTARSFGIVFPRLARDRSGPCHDETGLSKVETLGCAMGG